MLIVVATLVRIAKWSVFDVWPTWVALNVEVPSDSTSPAAGVNNGWSVLEVAVWHAASPIARQIRLRKVPNNIRFDRRGGNRNHHPDGRRAQRDDRRQLSDLG